MTRTRVLTSGTACVVFGPHITQQGYHDREVCHRGCVLSESSSALNVIVRRDVSGASSCVSTVRKSVCETGFVEEHPALTTTQAGGSSRIFSELSK